MRKCGFTLIEILVVVIIMFTLVTLSIPTYQKTTEESQKRKAGAALNIIRAAEIIYRTDSLSYYPFAGLNNAARDMLKINVYDNIDWKYIVSADPGQATATAVRQRGRHSNPDTGQIRMDLGSGNIVYEYTW